MLVATVVLKLSSLVFDVEVAFLNAKMDFDNYMGTPKGVEAAPDECVLLQKALYGSLQSKQAMGCLLDNSDASEDRTRLSIGARRATKTNLTSLGKKTDESVR